MLYVSYNPQWEEDDSERIIKMDRDPFEGVMQGEITKKSIRREKITIRSK